MLSIPIKIIVSICSMLSCLSAFKKSTSSLIYFFLTILQRNSKHVILINLAILCHTHLKWQYHSEETIDVYHGTIIGKSSTLSFTFFLRYCKDIVNLLFWVLWAFPITHTHKMIVSTYRRLWYLSTCQKYTSSFTSFLRYYILKNSVIWLANSILAHDSRLRNLLHMGLVVKYQ